MLEWGGKKSSLLTMLSFILDIHMEMSSKQAWNCAERTEMLCKTPLRSHVRCSQTHLTHEPLLICSVSVAGSAWAPTDFFVGGNLTNACFPGVRHLPPWGFPTDADLLSACVKQVGSEEELTPHGENLWPRGNGSQWINSSLFLSLEPVLRCIHSCGLLEDGPWRWSNRSCLIPSRSQLCNAPLYLFSFLSCLTLLSSTSI